MIQWRRNFHAHPELSNREERTAAKVAGYLRAMGVDQIKTGVAHHGVVALIRGRQEGPTVALRRHGCLAHRRAKPACLSSRRIRA